MEDMEPRRRVAALTVVLALGLAAAVLALYAIDEGKGADALRALLVPGDPDLAFADPFVTASGVATVALATALALGVLVVLAGRRIPFVLSSLWSLLVLGGLVSALAPTAARLREWQVTPVGLPLEALDLILAAACVSCLAGSVLGWAITSPGWDWLSAPVARTHALLTPQNHES
jgi:hypothetical protein